MPNLSDSPACPSALPPHLQAGDKVILFDGVCKLCNGWSRFIIRFDQARQFKLASVQSPEGQAILQYFNMPLDHFDTMLLVEGNQAHEKSEAFLRVVRHLPWPFRVALLWRIFPKPVRDWMYDRIALNRYRLFGKYAVCMLPTPDHQKRFLS